MDKIIVPVSRFRRELNKWMRFIKNNPDEAIHITRNKKSEGVIVSPEWYERTVNEYNLMVEKYEP